VFNRSPPNLLQEIILIDDASTYTNLGIKLEKYISSQIFDNKIKLHRNKKREGLIRGRMFGAKLAQGEVLVFLDSHMEVTTTWLPPLLEPLVHRPDIATSPIIKGMSHFVGYGTRGNFLFFPHYQIADSFFIFYFLFKFFLRNV
jgi:polypeptide N-acetylgalactosaminyltransferase